MTNKPTPPASIPVNALADFLKMAYPAILKVGDEDAGLEIASLDDLFDLLHAAEKHVEEDILPFYKTHLENFKEVIIS